MLDELEQVREAVRQSGADLEFYNAIGKRLADLRRDKLDQ
jgi:hypothetical protein